ncbi:MAG: hypothetical protein KDI11_01415 [Alphaproteobacteria bacterium]|nr:hypothetical protein [Alphaproteobacteria bacterium]
MKKLTLTLLAGSALLLTGCIDRETADVRLVNGCKAGIEAFLYEGDRIEKIVSKTLRTPTGLGNGYREVMLNATITDGFHPHDEDYTCIFMEEFGPFKMSYRASIYNIDLNGRIIGQKGYEIQGDLKEMQKLTGAVDAALK